MEIGVDPFPPRLSAAAAAAGRGVAATENIKEKMPSEKIQQHFHLHLCNNFRRRSFSR
jgi:hypothetical protein